MCETKPANKLQTPHMYVNVSPIDEDKSTVLPTSRQLFLHPITTSTSLPPANSDAASIVRDLLTVANLQRLQI